MIGGKDYGLHLAYTKYWEALWENGGLKFEGAGWHFELPDLYIMAKRYDDALTFVTELKHSKPSYAIKADSYINRIETLKEKKLKCKKRSTED